MQKMPRCFYAQDTITVAQQLLGQYLIHRVDSVAYIGRIVETEAYLGPHDLAAHSAKGITKRTQIMFGPPGYAYVYLIYGMHHCMNIVTESEGHGSAVLLRALEPVENITLRTQGPGLLTKAMQIDLSLNGHDMLSEDLFVAADLKPLNCEIVKRSRIGVAYAKEWANALLRFYIKDNIFVSKR